MTSWPFVFQPVDTCMTRKLYWDDPQEVRFGAEIVDRRHHDGKLAIVLDQTAFYPLGGGQPADRGTINDIAVLDVGIGDDGAIFHVLPDDPGFEIGEKVSGNVDWQWRREMTQQHTGQHILSQAFFQLFGAETRGFRINDQLAEIDLTLESPPDQVPSAIEKAEGLANSIVFDDRVIRTHLLNPEEASRLPLRKESFVTDCVRVIEIEDFDWSPCGGTHARSTGQVGLIVVRAWEHAKRMVRLHFACGTRALTEYRSANSTASNIARRFTVAREDADASVMRLADECKTLTRRVRELAQIAARAEARDLHETGIRAGEMLIVARVLDGSDLDHMKLLAHSLVTNTGTVALLATREKEMARLVFARSADLHLDLNRMLNKACLALGGKGGGRSDFAQGGGPDALKLEEVLNAAIEECSSSV